MGPTAIPQYELGHLPIMEELEKAESKLPGLWVAGNYRTGVAFPDCVTFGYEKAKEVKSFLNAQSAPVSAKAESKEEETEPATANGEGSAPSIESTEERKIPFFMTEK